MVEVEIIQACEDHIPTIAVGMRDIDCREVAAASGNTPFKALEIGLENSELCWTGMIDRVPAAMFGVVNLGYTGVPWMLGTDRLSLVSKRLLMDSKGYVKAMLGVNKLLQNYVHAENESSIRWLKWLGFEMSEPEPYGVLREMFRLFKMRAQDV